MLSISAKPCCDEVCEGVAVAGVVVAGAAGGAGDAADGAGKWAKPWARQPSSNLARFITNAAQLAA